MRRGETLCSKSSSRFDNEALGAITIDLKFILTLVLGLYGNKRYCTLRAGRAWLEGVRGRTVF